MVFPLIVAGIQAAASIAGAVSQESQAAKTRDALTDLMDKQDELYQLQRRARAASMRDLLFNQMNAMEQLRLEKRNQIAQSKLESLGVQLQDLQAKGQLLGQRFAANQELRQQLFNLSRGQEEQAKERGQAFMQLASTARETQGTVAKARRDSQTTNVTLSETEFARQQGVNQQLDTVVADTVTAVERERDRINRERELSQRYAQSAGNLFQLQAESTQALLQLAQTQNQLSTQYALDAGEINRDNIRAQNRLNELAVRANTVAQRNAIRANMRADRANLAATKAQIRAGMPSSSIAPGLFSALGSLVQGAAPLFLMQNGSNSGLINQLPPTTGQGPVAVPPPITWGQPLPGTGTITSRPPITFGQPLQGGLINTRPPVTFGQPVSGGLINTRPPVTFGQPLP